MSLHREIARLRTEVDQLGAACHNGPPPTSPAAIMEASALPPDPWQRRVLETEHKRTLLL